MKLPELFDSRAFSFVEGETASAFSDVLLPELLEEDNGYPADFARWVEETGPKGARRWRNADNPTAKPVYREPAGQGGEDQAPASGPAHYQAIDRWIKKSKLKPEQASNYRAVMRDTLDGMTPGARDHFLQNVGEVRFMKDPIAVRKEWARHKLPEKAGLAAFWFEEKDGPVTFMCADGGVQGSPGGIGPVRSVYAHEVWHAVDRGEAFSGSREWQRAWKKEVGRGSAPLTKYATVDPGEGFAEFGRLVISDPQGAREFPLCWAFFHLKGLA